MKNVDTFTMAAAHVVALLTHMLKHASDDRTREHINSIYFAPEGAIVATDGHRLACVDLDVTLAHGGYITRAEATTLLALLKTCKGPKYAPPMVNITVDRKSVV